MYPFLKIGWACLIPRVCKTKDSILNSLSCWCLNTILLLSPNIIDVFGYWKLEQTGAESTTRGRIFNDLDKGSVSAFTILEEERILFYPDFIWVKTKSIFKLLFELMLIYLE